MTKREFKEMIKFLNIRIEKSRHICSSINYYTCNNFRNKKSPLYLFNSLFNQDCRYGWIADDHLLNSKRSLENVKLIRFKMLDIFEEICLDTEIYNDWRLR